MYDSPKDKNKDSDSLFPPEVQQPVPDLFPPEVVGGNRPRSSASLDSGDAKIVFVVLGIC